MSSLGSPKKMGTASTSATAKKSSGSGVISRLTKDTASSAIKHHHPSSLQPSTAKPTAIPTSSSATFSASTSSSASSAVTSIPTAGTKTAKFAHPLNALPPSEAPAVTHRPFALYFCRRPLTAPTPTAKSANPTTAAPSAASSNPAPPALSYSELKRNEATLLAQVASLTSALTFLQSTHTSTLTSHTTSLSTLQAEVTRLTTLNASLTSSLATSTTTVRVYEQRLQALGVDVVNVERRGGGGGGEGGGLDAGEGRVKGEVEGRVWELKERVEKRLQGMGGGAGVGEGGGGASTPCNTPRTSVRGGGGRGMRVMEGIEEGPLLMLDEEVKVLSERESMGGGCGVGRLSVDGPIDRSYSEAEIFASAF